MEVSVTVSSSQQAQPPWEFLLTASRNTLQSYELSRLNHAANLHKEISALLDQWLAENASAMLARWLMEQRERTVLAAAEEQGAEAGSASDNFLGQRVVTPEVQRRRG